MKLLGFFVGQSPEHNTTILAHLLVAAPRLGSYYARMDPPPPPDAELDALSAQVDEQLNLLQSASTHDVYRLRSTEGQVQQVPAAPTQQTLIEKVTGESFDTFWQKYRRHLRRDLCLSGGMLNEQWQKYRDIESKSAVRVSYAWLAAMGIPTASLAPAAVAAPVFLLNVLLKVGIDTICEGCAEEEEARKEATK